MLREDTRGVFGVTGTDNRLIKEISRTTMQKVVW